jgi:Protein of unknown function (DUF2510)
MIADVSSLSSLLNLLVVVLVVAAVVAVVIWVVRAATAPRYSRSVVEDRGPVEADGHRRLAPGWYPDQNDPNLTRYFDGQMWTTATRPGS